MDTIKINIEIAKYMGYEDMSKYWYGGDFMERKKETLENGVKVYSKIKYEDLDYHINFNSLMDVVDEIGVKEKVIVGVWMTPRNSKIFLNGKEMSRASDQPTKLMNLHRAVYESIKSLKSK